jgi:hypothetical protein
MTERSNMRRDDQPGIRFGVKHSTPYQRRLRRANRRPLFAIGNEPKESAVMAFLDWHVSKADAFIVVGAVVLILMMLAGWPWP